MVKVLHVFEYFNQGGIENFVMNVYRNIDRTKIQFDFAFINRTKGVFDEEVKDMGAHIYYFDTEKKVFSNYRKSLKRIINENGPYDVIHSHMYYFSGYILKIAKSCGVPIRIAHSHETLKGRKPTIKRRIYEFVMRKMILKNATQLLSCSDAAGDCVFGSQSNCQTLYNGIDVNRFSFNNQKRNEFRKKLEINDTDKLILNVGRFNKQKNHKFIIETFEKLKKQRCNVKLLLIGVGPLEDEVRKDIHNRNLDNDVIILKNIYDVENYYSASDVFWLPSLYEGMSIVSVEAQTNGLPSFVADNITREIGVTNLIKFLPINNSEIWINETLSVIDKVIDRNNYYKEIENTPFNVKVTVSDLSNIYLGKENERK